MPAVNFQFDSSELNAALRRAYLTTDKLPADLVNQKGWRIFQKATWYMPQVSAATIAGELGAGVNLRLLKSGKRKGQFARNKKVNFFGVGESRTEGVPLLALIIQARTRKSGKRSPWYGVDRATGAQQMRDEMKKIYGARQKSRAYFKACFATIRDVFRRVSNSLPLSDPNSRGSGTVASLARDRGRLADARPAVSRAAFARADFWLVSPRHDLKDAISKHAAPVLQRAFDEEASETWNHAIQKEYIQALRAVGISAS